MKICPKIENKKCEFPCSYHGKPHEHLNACDNILPGIDKALTWCPICIEIEGKEEKQNDIIKKKDST